MFAIFVTLPILDMKEMGIGFGAAVLIDASIVRAVLLPARARTRAGTPIRLTNPTGGGWALPASTTTRPFECSGIATHSGSGRDRW